MPPSCAKKIKALTAKLEAKSKGLEASEQTNKSLGNRVESLEKRLRSGQEGKEAALETRKQAENRSIEIQQKLNKAEMEVKARVRDSANSKDLRLQINAKASTVRELGAEIEGMKQGLPQSKALAKRFENAERSATGLHRAATEEPARVKSEFESRIKLIEGQLK